MTTETATRINLASARIDKALVRSKKVDKERARAYVRHSNALDPDTLPRSLRRATPHDPTRMAAHARV